jgi:poly-gamma-glutamate capsule biosynthesis protein CapA/YwtB (metallophosphatase superfamily)
LVIVLIAAYPLMLASQPGDTARLSLVFAGDMMGHEEQITGAWDSATRTYNYEPTFRYIKPYIDHADLAVVNLEVTLAGSPYKGYPQFSSPDALALAAKNAGFDIFVQANNHALDRGKAGFIRTLAVLDSMNILHTGTFADAESRLQQYPLMVEKNGFCVAILNYTYGTNGLEIPKPFIINRIDTSQISKDLNKARTLNPDFIMVTIHWGLEYERIENQQQKNLATFLLKHGADAIIGSHPHVVQPVDLYYTSDSLLSKVVVFSLGNFVSNQRAQYKDGGIVFGLDLIKNGGNTTMEKVSYLPYWVYREDLSNKSTFYVLPVNYYETNSDSLILKEHDRYKIARFAKDTREHLRNVPENKFFSKGD